MFWISIKYILNSVSVFAYDLILILILGNAYSHTYIDKCLKYELKYLCANVYS